MIGVDRTMFGKDTPIRAVTGSHIGEDSLIQEMLPVIITTVIFMCLFSAKHWRCQCLQIRIDTFSSQCTAFYLPGIRDLQLVQQTGIMTNNFRTDNTETTPLVRRAELIPVSDAFGNIPFEKIIIRRIFLIYINLIARRNIYLIRFFFYYLANLHFRFPASVIKSHRDGRSIVSGTKFHNM